MDISELGIESATELLVLDDGDPPVGLSDFDIPHSELEIRRAAPSIQPNGYDR